MKKKIAIIDYGLGNVLSAQQSFNKVIKENNLSASTTITKDPNLIDSSTHVVLPGQGAFKSCMSGLEKVSGMVDSLEKFALKNKKPFLGICVGMQLLAIDSEENGNHLGLGWIKGHIKKMPTKKLKMPHMGWNEVMPKLKTKSRLDFKKSDYYFVHSYYFECDDEKNILAYTNYGINFASIVFKENIYGVQFHPEKSSDQGLGLIKSFISL